MDWASTGDSISAVIDEDTYGLRRFPKLRISAGRRIGTQRRSKYPGGGDGERCLIGNFLDASWMDRLEEAYGPPTTRDYLLGWLLKYDKASIELIPNFM